MCDPAGIGPGLGVIGRQVQAVQKFLMHVVEAVPAIKNPILKLDQEFLGERSVPSKRVTAGIRRNIAIEIGILAQQLRQAAPRADAAAGIQFLVVPIIAGDVRPEPGCVAEKKRFRTMLQNTFECFYSTAVPVLSLVIGGAKFAI